MPLYETVVIARSEITQAQADAVADAATTTIETDFVPRCGSNCLFARYYVWRSS